MENDVTVQMIRDAVRDNQPELAAQLVVLLAKDRDLWKEQAVETILFVSERKEQIDTLKRVNAEQLARIEELSDQVLEMRLTFEQEKLSWFASAMKHKDKIRELETENQKLREAAVQARWPNAIDVDKILETIGDVDPGDDPWGGANLEVQRD